MVSQLKTKTTVILTSARADAYGYHDDNSSCELEMDDLVQEVFDIGDAVKSKWFCQELEKYGFFHVTNITEENKHLDNYIYELKNKYGSQFQNKLDERFCGVFELERVFQEVLGPDRLKVVENFTKKRNAYLRKEEARQLEAKQRKEARKEKKLSTQVEDAKNLLKKVGVL